MFRLAIVGVLLCLNNPGLVYAGPVPLPGGCVAWWRADGDTLDSSGTNHGALLHEAISYAPGMVGQGFRFAGPNAGIRVPASPSLNVGPGDGFTVELWLNPDALSVGIYAPITQWFLDPYNAVVLVHGGDGASPSPGMLFGVLYGGGPYYGTPPVLVAGVFQHVAFVYDRATGTSYIYHNGIAVAGGGVGTPPTVTTSCDLYIGINERNSQHDRCFSGVMDELAIYNRALSAAEITAIHAAGSAGKWGGLIRTQPKSQVGYWGKSVTFSVVAATNYLPVLYQWQFSGVPIPDATNATLVLTNLQSTNAGIYTVVVSDSASHTNTSVPANLTINPAGVAVALYAGVTIDGVVGLTYGIQSSSDLSDTNSWFGRTNVTLSGPTQLWYDSQPASQAQRFYRVVPGPIPIP